MNSITCMIMLALTIPIVLVAREEDSSQDKMVLSGLTSNHNKVFGVGSIIKPKKSNPNILNINIDSTEYDSWLTALNKLLIKGKTESNARVIIGIQRANKQLKTYLDRLNGLDKTGPEASEKIKKTLQDVTAIQKDLTALVVDKQSIIYAAYEAVFATCVKIQKELGSLLDILQGSQLMAYDADNVIKKQSSDQSFENRTTEIKKLYDSISYFEISIFCRAHERDAYCAE